MSVAVAKPESASPSPSPVRRGGQRRSKWLLAAGWFVALCAIAPIGFLLAQSVQSGWGAISSVLFRRLTASLLTNTIEMTVLTTAFAVVLGVSAAWILERTDVPFRRMFFVALLVPAAIPDFIETFGWINVWPSLRGLWGSVFVLGLAVYPFVMLPVVAALRRIDHRREEVARSLGTSSLRIFTRITLPELTVSIAGGCLLVALQLLAEYGSFQMLGFRTFTTEIFTTFQVGFDTPGACALSLVLVVLSAILVRIESSVGGRERTLLASDVTAPSRMRLGRLRWIAAAGLAGLGALSLGVPVGSVLDLLLNPGPATLPSSSLWGSLGYTIAYATLAGIFSVVGATIVALSSHRARSWLAKAPSNAALVPLAIPGVVVALALTFAAENYFQGRWYQTSALLVAAYSVMFLPLALVGIRSSLAQVPLSLGEVAATLGANRMTQFFRVTLPLIAPGLGVGFALVFLTTLTELTATLVLIPTGAQTLATEFWSYQVNLAYGQAAPYAAAMMLLAGVPLLLLTSFGLRSEKVNR